jgi:uncharacterized protein YjeT (DUF2065 family)
MLTQAINQGRKRLERYGLVTADAGVGVLATIPRDPALREFGLFLFLAGLFVSAIASAEAIRNRRHPAA